MVKCSGECMGNGLYEGKENFMELKVEFRGMYGKCVREWNRECMFSRMYSECIVECLKNV